VVSLFALTEEELDLTKFSSSAWKQKKISRASFDYFVGIGKNRRKKMERIRIDLKRAFFPARTKGI